jgi:outer membrane protein assembly factor BamB
MTHQSRALNLASRRPVIRLLVLLGLVAAVVGGIVGWQHFLHAPTFHPVYQHTPNAINTGKSVLYLSSSEFAPAPTQLTMMRTGDGAKLWQYSLHGTLSTGYVPTVSEALANGQAVEIANGVVYFVVDPNHLGSPDREQYLMALRADDGAVLWQRPLQGAAVDLFGVSDGVVCLRITKQQGSLEVSSALYGYSAETGRSVWQRQGADVTGSRSTHYSVFLLDGILYVTGSAAAATPSSTATIEALQASTGQMLWQYAQPSPLGAYNTNFPPVAYPVAADDGVLALSSAGAELSGRPRSELIGIRERDGTVLWHYQTSSIIMSVPHGGINAPGILEQGGVLYFGTTSVDTSLQLSSLQLTTGRLLWRQSISAAHFVLWDLVLGNGSVYAILVPQWQGPHPSFDGLTFSALEMRNGTLRWQDRPAVQGEPYIAGTGDIVLFASGNGLAGLRAADGALLWHRATATAAFIATADGTVVVSSVAVNGSDTWAGTLCDVQPASGSMRWCNQFVTGLAAAVIGP